METKEIKFDNKVIARYEFEDDILYLKIYLNLIPTEYGLLEEMIASIVQLVENRQFKSLSYLNIP